LFDAHDHRAGALVRVEVEAAEVDVAVEEADGVQPAADEQLRRPSAGHRRPYALQPFEVRPGFGPDARRSGCGHDSSPCTSVVGQASSLPAGWKPAPRFETTRIIPGGPRPATQ